MTTKKTSDHLKSGRGHRHLLSAERVRYKDEAVSCQQRIEKAENYGEKEPTDERTVDERYDRQGEGDSAREKKREDEDQFESGANDRDV